jgi:hemerythrin-like domain-containing protein
MATASTRSTGAKSTRSTTRKTTGTRAQDAIALLKADHKAVDEMFKQFDSAKADSRKQTLTAKIIMALKVHTQIEEEIFYPACRGEIDDDMLDEARVEHQSAKDLIAQIEGMQVGDQLYDAKVTVLGEYIRHHVKEEEGEMFPAARKAGLDLKGLGERLKARKDELEREMKAKVQ